MRNRTDTGRREFVACCVCAGCAGLALGAQPSNRNAKSLAPSTTTPSTPAKTLTPITAAGKTAAKRNFDVAYCGIYCGACELYLKGGKDGKKCKRCTHPSMESQCGVFKCAEKKKVENCGLCDSFESCDILQKHHEKPLYRQVARRTCADIKENGMEAVTAKLKTRWTCPSCEKLFPWNTTENCPACGKAIEALSEKDA